MPDSEYEPTPAERAWTIVESMVRMFNGDTEENRVSITVPTEPHLVGQLVEQLAKIAAVQMLGIDDPYKRLEAIKHLVAEFAPTVAQTTLTEDDLAKFRETGHYGPDGPVVAVQDFLDTVAAGSPTHWWSLLDPELQLVRAQAWLYNNQDSFDLSTDRDDLEREFTSAMHPAWLAFANTELAQLQNDWEHWLQLRNNGQLGAASRSRPIAPDTEVVLLTATPVPDTPVIYNEPTQIEAFSFVVRHNGQRWLIRAYGSTPHAPGWPPDLG